MNRFLYFSVFLFISSVACGLDIPSPKIDEGNVLAKGGDYPHALEALNEAISLDPMNARAYKIRGHVYYAMGDYQTSLNDMDKVVELAPESANAYVDRAIVYSSLSQHGKALSDVEVALSLKPDSVFAQEVRKKILENASTK